MLRSTCSILLSIGFIGLFARLSYDIPVGNGIVPISGQTFALFLAAWYLKPAESINTVLLYILFGGLGLPIFAGGASGWIHLSGYTAGYLWTFVPSAALVSYYSSKYSPSSFLKIFTVIFFATLLILCVGAFILAWKTNTPEYFNDGSFPYVPGGIIKSLLAAAIIIVFQKYTSSKPNR